LKAVFLGGFAASVAPRILAKVKTLLATEILADEGDAARLVPLLADADIVVGHIWRAAFPAAPRMRLLQSVAAGLDQLDLNAVSKGVTLCEPAIAEYVMMTILVLTHRMFDTVTTFRAGSWSAQPTGGSPHGEILGRTIGILGYGRIGREVAKRAVGFGCKVIAANRSPIADPTLSGEVFPLAELDRMLPQCDALVVAAGLAPETQGLINARRLALMKPTAVLVNIARASILDEDALYAALRDRRLAGAALDVWWQTWSLAHQGVRPSRFPFRPPQRADDAALLRLHRGDRRTALECGRRQSRPLCLRQTARKRGAPDLTRPLKSGDGDLAVVLG
jgi:phosphoglycerate dehydrogenase-like enzyme